MTRDEFIDCADIYIQQFAKGSIADAEYVGRKIVDFLNEVNPPQAFKTEIEDTIIDAAQAHYDGNTSKVNRLLELLLNLINELFTTYVDEFTPSMAAALVAQGISFR